MNLRGVSVHIFIGLLLFCLGACNLNAAVDTIALPDAGLQIKLDRNSGLVQEIISIEPTEKRVSGQMEIFCSIKGKEYVFDTVAGSKMGKDSATFKLKPKSLKQTPLRVKVEYSWAKGNFFQEKVYFTATKNISDGCKIGFRHKWDSSSWSKLVGGTRPIRVIEADKPTLVAYGRAVNDMNLTKLDKYQASILPLFVAEGDDRFVLAGDLSLDAFVTMSPNYPQDTFPSVQRNPKSFKKDETLELSVVFKSFSGKNNLLRDVWRWYNNNVTSHNPVISRYLNKVPDKQTPMGEGNWCAFTYYDQRRENRTPPGSHIWWSMWHDQVRERYPTSGHWWVNFPWGVWDKGKMSAKRQKRELSRIMEMGHKPYLYFRNLVNLRSPKHGDLKKSWIKKAEEGDYERYGTGRGLGWNLPEIVKKDTGYKRVQWGFLNWANDEMRDKYFKSVVRCVNFYKPKGIAMDFSWKANEPEIFETQARIFNWVKKNHPDMKIAINGSWGSPNQLIADVSLIENGALGNTGWYDIEAAKAMRTNFVTLERFNLFEAATQYVVNGKKTWICQSGLNDVKRIIDYTSKVAPQFKGNVDRLKVVAHLRAGMRNIGMGSGWGYIEECPGNELVSDFAGEINGLVLLSDSFDVQLPSGSDRDGHCYASTWEGDEKLRVALFNDDDLALSTTVKIKVDKRWDKCDNVKAFVVTSLRKKYKASVKKSYKNGILEFRVNNLSPFSLLTISLDESADCK